MKNTLYDILDLDTAFSKVRKVFFILSFLPLFLLTSCIDDLDLFKSPFAIVYPHNNAKYIGDNISDFKITYSKPVTTADVFLNGTRINNEFNYGQDSATAPINKIRKYLKEGENVLTVDPLAFGPTIRFVADTSGPEILVKDGRDDPDNPGKFRIRGDVRDASAISELKVSLVTVNGINDITGELSREASEPISILVKQDKSWEIGNLDVATANIYRFEATDIHGFRTVKEYLANNAQSQSLAVGNAVRLAVGDTLVKSLKPFIASAIYQGLEEKPIDVYNVCPSNNPNCSKFPPGLNPVRLNMDLLGGGTAILKNLYMSKPKSTVLLNDFTVLEGNKIFIDLDITDMTVDLDINGTALGFLPIDVAIKLKIGRTAVVSDAELSVVNKKMHLKLVNSNIDLENIDTGKVVVWGIDLTFIAGPIVGLLEGLIADMLPDILNPIFEENLQKLVIGGRMYDEEEYNAHIENGGNPDQLDGVKAYFDWALNIETIITDSVLGGAEEMIVSLETLANVLPSGVDQQIQNRALGSIYVEDPVRSSDIFNAKAEGTANLTFALSSNALNQAFVAIYNTGLSHFTLFDGKMYYGADKAKPVGVKGKTRIRLYPESPPFFILQSLSGQVGGAAEASVGYESAVLYFDRHNGTGWESEIELHVDLKIAASIDQEDNIVKLGIHGSPTLNINKTVNNTALPITNKLLQTIVDAVLVYFVPTVNENFLRIDMAEVAEGINGTRVFYRHHSNSTDMSGELVKIHNRYEFNVACDGVNECVPQGEQGCSVTGGCVHVCDTLGNTAYTVKEGGSLVCQTINFEMSTNTVSSTGNRGSNLFFQMQANEVGFQPPPGLPRFDLDGDGVMDFRDNCAVPQQMIEAAVSLKGGILANVNPDGTPMPGFEDSIKKRVNAWVACDLVGENALTSGTCGSYRQQPYVDPSFDSIKVPTHSSIINDTSYRALSNRNIVQWWDYMRKGDDGIGNMLHEFDYPWIALRYNNPNQLDTDGDRVGELCEDDSDRDGIYTSNGFPADNCPSIYDPTNNPGVCTIDAVDDDGTASFVLFKNMRLSEERNEPWCLSHGRFNGVPTNTGGAADFTPGQSDDGRQLTWAKCSASDFAQRFYVTVTDFERTGVNEQEKVVYLYTNPSKQSTTGWYDEHFYHFLATTVSSAAPNIGEHYRPTANDKYWNQDSVIATAMPGYANEANTNWRQWVLSLSMEFDSNKEPVAGQEAFENYPYIIESMRIWDVYGRSGGVDPGRRDCIYYTGTNTASGVADTNKGSCYPNDTEQRKRAAFDILLGEELESWRGRYSTD